MVTEKIITPIPNEFIEKATINWKVIPIQSEKYDVIIGIGFLRAFESLIDIKNNNLKIFNKYILFLLKIASLIFLVSLPK